MIGHNEVPVARDPETERRFWNNWIADCLESEHLDCSTWKPGEAALRLLNGLNLSRPNILEVGCANGWLSARLTRFGRLTAIDLADEAIASARTRYRDVTFIAGDFMTAELPAKQFDVVLSLSVISVFADQRRFVERVAELLKPGGYLILTCAHKFIWDRTDFVWQSRGEIPLNWLNIRDLKGLLRERFSVLHIETIIPAGNRGILRIINSYWLNRLIQKVISEGLIVRLKEKLRLGRALVVVARKRT